MVPHIGSLRIPGEQTGVFTVTLKWSLARTCVVSSADSSLPLAFQEEINKCKEKQH